MKRTMNLRKRGESGSTAVEFSLIAFVLFALIFGTIEVARAMFVWNTMAHITARAARTAAMTNFNDSAAMTKLRRDALAIAAVDDRLILANEITHENIVIDYLQRDGIKAVTTLTSPTENAAICMTNPNDARCIHFVRARLCKKDSECSDHVPYVPLVPFPGVDKLNVPMPWFSAVVPVETLGTPCACP